MTRAIKTLKDVVDWGLCIGCGACFYACNKGAVSLMNIESIGIRPRFDINKCSNCTECLSICPGHMVNGNMNNGGQSITSESDIEFGPVIEIWEGYAVDPEIRYSASSGGILSALAIYCLEKENMEFVLHTGMDRKSPWLNKTCQSWNRDDILSQTGSRYAPASPCEGIGYIENSNGQCVFIGKPCDAAAVSMLRRQRSELDRNLGLVITFFCAGTPSTQGTLDLIKSLNISLDEIDRVRYRGEGWPGNFKVLFNNRMNERSLSYEDSWGRLTKYVSLRCRLCPHGLGRIADISCGDAWHINPKDDRGHSIVLVRTPRGKEILNRAIDAKYVELRRITPNEVIVAQVNLLQRRKHLFGRLLALRLMLVPIPRFKGFSLFRSWIKLSFLTKIRTIIGTLRRIISRGLWRRQFLPYEKYE